MSQLDSLLQAGISTNSILVIGASAGSDIVIHVSAKMKNESLKYVIMGGCWPDLYKSYLNIELYGQFLSIIEKSDPHGTCVSVFKGRKFVKSHKEITLHTGLSHGFIYKGNKAWIDPIMAWFKEK